MVAHIGEISRPLDGRIIRDRNRLEKFVRYPEMFRCFGVKDRRIILMSQPKEM